VAIPPLPPDVLLRIEIICHTSKLAPDPTESGDEAAMLAGAAACDDPEYWRPSDDVDIVGTERRYQPVGRTYG